MSKTFKPTSKQKEAIKLCGGDSTHIMLFGGSRSGKTFILVRNVIMRALMAPKSRHVILRFRFNHVKQSVFYDTFLKVIDICFKGLQYRADKTDWFVEFENGSQIWFGGLDDKERTEKILGNEYSTIYLNECSQISNHARELVRTRLAQKINKEIDGVESELPLRMYYDCNPPSMNHWAYKIFIKKMDPDTKRKIPDPEEFTSMKMNPVDNQDNLNKKYLNALKNLSPRMRKRFFDGDFSDGVANQLFSGVVMDSNRVNDGELPDMVRVIIGVDPSGSGDQDNAHNDAIGIICGGLGTDGKAYLLEDNTVKAGPKTWGGVATNLFDRRQADLLVGEKNYGGEMVRFVLQTSKPDLPFKFVTATRGKTVRAEPFSSLYENGKICHVGHFHDLEDELQGFTTNGYMGADSPNRADAWIWVLSELFAGMVNKTEKPKFQMSGNSFGW